MNDANHALDVLGRKLGIAGLSFDDDGLVALAMTPELSFYITRVDAEEMEVSCPIPSLGYPDPPLLRAMLEAHYLGAGVGAGRLAVDADRHEVILCERWVVADMDASVLERRFEDFTANAIFLLGDGAEALLDRAETIRAEEMDRDSSFAPPSMMDDVEDAPIVMRL